MEILGLRRRKMEDVERFHELRLVVRQRKLSCDGSLTDGHAGRGWAMHGQSGHRGEDCSTAQQVVDMAAIGLFACC